MGGAYRISSEHLNCGDKVNPEFKKRCKIVQKIPILLYFGFVLKIVVKKCGSFVQLLTSYIIDNFFFQ